MVASGTTVHPLGQTRGVGAVVGVSPATESGSGNGFPGWQQHSSPPQGSGSAKKGGDSARRDVREALGRSCGGFGTKACVIADGRGRAITFKLAPGQSHELPLAIALLDSLPTLPKWIVADRGLASDDFRQHIWDRGARPAIPPRKTDPPVACPDWIYNNRARVENLWARLKEWRTVATRYEKTKASFLSVLSIAATVDWIKI